MAGYGTFVMLTAPDAVRDVFRGDAEALHSGEGNEFLSLTVGPNSVLVLDGEPHARQRAALLPGLKGERMRAFVGAMEAEARAALAAWPVGTPVRTAPWMRKITLRVILRSVLGVGPGPELDAFERLVEDLLGFSRSRYSLVLIKVVPLWAVRAPWQPYQRRLRRLDRAVREFVGRRRREPDAAGRESILDDLLAVRTPDGRPLSDDEVRDAVVTVMTAGYDTTAVALTWALSEVAARPDVADAIRAEARRGSAARPYLDAAIREVLRLRTIFPFVVRLTKRPFAAGGREYPAGVLLAPCAHLVHRRPELYPDPGRFDPGRFLARRYTADEWLPFGGGGRMCPGMAFALAEVRAVLSVLLAERRLARPAGAGAPRAVRRGLALAPHDDAPLVVSPP
jgi:cytochrome P450